MPSGFPAATTSLCTFCQPSMMTFQSSGPGTGNKGAGKFREWFSLRQPASAIRRVPWNHWGVPGSRNGPAVNSPMPTTRTMSSPKSFQALSSLAISSGVCGSVSRCRKLIQMRLVSFPSLKSAHRVVRAVAIEVRRPVRVVARRRKAALVEMRGHADAGGVAHRVLEALQHRVARLQLAQLEQRHRAGHRAKEAAAVDEAVVANRDAFSSEELHAELIGRGRAAEAFHDEHGMVSPRFG